MVAQNCMGRKLGPNSGGSDAIMSFEGRVSLGEEEAKEKGKRASTHRGS